MAKATGAQAGLRYVAEVTAGTTPVTPQMIEVPYVSTTLDLSKELIQDPTIVSDRMEREEAHGNRIVQGDIVVTHRHDQYDDWVEAVTGGTWSSDVVKVSSATGGTPRSFTFEQDLSNITQRRRFTGVRFNTWNFSGQINSNVTSTFGVIGLNMSTSTSLLDASPTAVLDKTPLKFIGGTATVNGVAEKLTSFTFTLNNGMNANYILTSDVADSVDWTETTLEGSVVGYLEDLTMYNLFTSGTTCAIVAQATDGTDTYTITIPKAKFNSASVPVPGAGMLFNTMNFKAYYDSVSGTVMSITRS